MRMKTWPLCLLLLLLLTAGTARADVTFTSTADFDAGTKAPTTGGNLGIETNTDNLGIAGGSLELGSLKGDSFTTADADADTAKWDLVSGLSTGCGVVSRTIAAGVMSISVQSGAVGCRRGVRTAVTVSGDWDIRIKIDTVLATGGTNLLELSVLNEALVYCTDGPSVDGLLYQATLTLVTHALDAFTCVNGGFPAVGSQTGPLTDPRWLRLTRATNTFTWYHSSDGSAWTQDEQTTNANIANPVYIILTVFSASLVDGTTSVMLDDHHLATGSVSAGGYRTIGDWTSLSQVSAETETVVNVNLAYSGSTANGYIDFVAIYDGATQIAFDGTNVIGGTSIDYTFSIDLPALWTFRIGLAGDGSATPNIQSIAITLTIQEPTGCFGESVFGSILFALFAIIAGVAIFSAVYFGVMSEEARLDVQVTGVLIIAIVITVTVVSGFLGAFQMGATLGC